ncbi:hypothetical protein BYZ73_15105 [Rhodovulum viride]|uniref:TnsA endonuclease-like protein n=1 Tax=Rhodovulum viride TaxID=1231134 RepID=A0ABX9DFM7_9RHOB|nr:hypothetical protein [Rhodovulum viride]RAP40406.1 hypothetical protein BYZ73_15105 [Rhodovulum viride]
MQILPNGDIQLPALSIADRDVPLASKGHFSGHVVIGGGAGRITQTESHLEMNGILCLHYRPDVREIREQVRFDWFDENGEVFSHYFDCVAVHQDGTKTAFAFKAARFATPKFLRKLGIIRAQAVALKVIDDVRVVTEQDLDPTEVHNAWLLHGMRHPDPEADARAAEVVEDIRGIKGLDQLSREIGLGARGTRALFRLIAAGRLQQAELGRLSPEIRVTCSAAPANDPVLLEDPTIEFAA